MKMTKYLYKNNVMKKLTNESFKERGFKIHNGKYSYYKTDLNNRDEKGRVCITCPIHGDFWQEPNNHLRGIGCSKCANNLKKSNEEVINEINWMKLILNTNINIKTVG